MSRIAQRRDDITRASARLVMSCNKCFTTPRCGTAIASTSICPTPPRSRAIAGLVVAGPLIGDWLHQVVDEWLGDSGMITGIEYSNRVAAFVGETVTAGGTVTAYDADSGEIHIGSVCQKRSR